VTIVRPADNPFASARIDRLPYRFSSGDVSTLIERLTRLGGRGAVVGRHGSGKTTLMGLLAGELPGEPVSLRLDAATRNPLRTAVAGLPTTVGSHHSILIDGAEQLGAPGWWRLRRRIRRAGAVVITSHRPARLPTLHECTATPELLRELVRELAPEVDAIDDLDTLFERHDGDLRRCFRELYDHCSRQS
jgi:hypothetical protein